MYKYACVDGHVWGFLYMSSIPMPSSASGCAPNAPWRELVIADGGASTHALAPCVFGTRAQSELLLLSSVRTCSSFRLALPPSRGQVAAALTRV